jgi:hypothetical protein
MVTRRSLLKQGAYATLSVATASILGRTAYTQNSPGFDFYISTTGSDSNPGTLDKPWAITALNTRRADYAGKRVGLLDGTYNVYALSQAAPTSGTALAVNGGHNANTPTLVAAVNARKAILTGADPTTGEYPTVTAAPLIGQGYNQVVNKGNVILDGLSVTRAWGTGIFFYPAQFPNQEGGVTGIVVRNCEVTDIIGLEANNPGAIKLLYCTGALISNNTIHSIQPTPPGINSSAIFSFLCRSNIYEYNTIFDCYTAIHDKNPRNGNHTFRYNYVDLAGENAFHALHDCVGGDPGDVVTVHNNIFAAPGTWYGSGISVPSKQGLLFYNNTCYCRSKEGGGIYYPASGSQVSPSAMVTFYNNILYCEQPAGWAGAVRYCEGTVALSNYNVYRVDPGQRGIFGLSPVSDAHGAPKLYTLSAWQKATGQDANSIASLASAASLFGGAKGPGAASYTLGSAVARNFGRVNGVSSGAPVDAGAWGGDVKRIGCDFGPAPRAPVLGIS